MDFEKLGAFYLGKDYDLEAGEVADSLLLYDARDLTTHAVCIGMTGSGKTGLCITLLEEAAIDQVPAIIIDPKGDITNLLLQFPELAADDFRPWINPDDARRKGKSLDQFAADQASLWEKGIGDWGQDGQRIRRLSESADFRVYTPGSEAGLPVSILHSFAAPDLSWDSEAETLRERVQGTVSAVLGLVGIEADPLRSREHILLSQIFEHFWRQGRDLNLEGLIHAVQEPPVTQLGAFEVDTFFPPRERFELAMLLNNIIAAPSFASWMQGQPLEIGGLLADPQGRPRHSIFSIAHLDDAERMFFVSLLLNEVVAWMRTQQGTTSLRALLYMDEIFGFFPPVENPPSKRPLLTLMKQARAFGLGVVLSTQNPVDLDYKGLTNAGSWFIGRLQTERDKNRLLDGLEGTGAAGLSRQEAGRIISSLDKRVFLLHNVHDEAPRIFHTRWAMSYLRGPLTRDQIAVLTADAKADPEPAASFPPPHEVAGAVAEETGTLGSRPPALGPGLEQSFLPVLTTRQAAQLQASRPADAGQLLYRPGLLARGSITFANRKSGVDVTREFVRLGVWAEGGLDWGGAASLDPRIRTTDEPVEGRFEPLADGLNDARDLKRQQKQLRDHLYRTERITVLSAPALGAYSEPGESERDFRQRLQLEAREARDDEVDRLQERYEKRLNALRDKIERAQIALEKKQATASARGQELLVSVGESVLGMFLGRRSGRMASGSMGKMRMRSTAKMAAREAEARLDSLERELKEMEEELTSKTDEITARWDNTLEEFETVEIQPRKADVTVDEATIAWAPHWSFSTREGSPVVVPAY